MSGAGGWAVTYELWSTHIRGGALSETLLNIHILESLKDL